jgi:anti-sigma regulatory factor (Ser/Thr protein kinase)
MRAHLIVRAVAGSTRELDGFVGAFAAEHGLSADDQARTLIVVEELLTNLTRYGYPKQLEPTGEAAVTLELEGSQLTVEFEDNGQPFDPLTSAAPDFDQSIESRRVGGLGLHMVRELAEEAHYSRRDGRNIVRLRWHIAG